MIQRIDDHGGKTRFFISELDLQGDEDRALQEKIDHNRLREDIRTVKQESRKLELDSSKVGKTILVPRKLVLDRSPFSIGEPRKKCNVPPSLSRSDWNQCISSQLLSSLRDRALL